MKPYVTIDNKKMFLPQEADVHRFEFGVGEYKGNEVYMLCPRLKTRYRLATGMRLERKGTEFVFQMSGSSMIQITVSLHNFRVWPLQIDWTAGNPISIKHDTEENLTAETVSAE
jgi:hypothetical protein